MNTRMQKIESKIDALSQRRAELFREWANLVKQNDRDYEFTGRSNPLLMQRADCLLKEQKAIGKEIMHLIQKVDSLIND